MKRICISLFCLFAALFTGCDNKPKTETPQKQFTTPAAPQMPAGHPAVTQATQPPGKVNPHAGIHPREIPAGSGKQGKVLQIINTNGYTYLEIADNGGKKVWLALPATKVKKGNLIEYPHATAVENFYSKSLNRTFPSLIMVDGIRVIK